MKRLNKQEKEDKKKFYSILIVKNHSWLKVLANMILFVFSFSIILLFFVPWQQTSQGMGYVIAYDPNDRVQNISSTVPGLVTKWYVRDGSKVKKGDPIVEIVDNDPQFVDRLKLERDAVLKKYLAAKAASETALLNYERQEELFDEGLSARTKFEKAKIEYKKLLASEATAAANLAKAEVNLSRQQNQLISAPRDGTILRVLHGSGSVFVKEGDILATFVPETLTPAIEVYIDGNDLPLVYPGREVRIQFEGWPAVQFAGWPSIAIGTFGGKVSIIDPSASINGKFRVIVVPSEDSVWPTSNYLRQGTRAFGWILLNEVSVGYELWRQFNGFPASLDGPPEDLIRIHKAHEKLFNGTTQKPLDSKKKKKSKNYKDIYKEK